MAHKDKWSFQDGRLVQVVLLWQSLKFWVHETSQCFCLNFTFCWPCISV